MRCWRRVMWGGWSAMVLVLAVWTAPLAQAAVLNAADISTQALPGRSARLPGVNLWYTDVGPPDAREVVVLLHPNTGTSDIWAEQSARLAAKGFRVIAFDRRGWGRSTPQSSQDNGQGSMAEDLENLAQYLKLDRFHLLGIAGGGFAALDYAAWQPRRLKSLIVGGSTGQLSDPSMKAVVARIEIPGVRDIPAAYREVGPSYRARDPEGVRRWQEIEDHAMQPGAKSQALHTPNTLAKIANLQMPMLLIAGGADLLAPPALMRMWAASLRQTPQWALLPEAGHALCWEEPDAFDRIVTDFLRQQVAGGS